MIRERILQVNSSFAVDKLMLVYLTGRTFSSEPSGSVPSEPESTLLRDLLTVLLRRIGLPKNRGGGIDQQE
jgi:hypothetical protein